MGRFVKALQHLVDQGDLEVTAPRRPAVNSVQLAGSIPVDQNSSDLETTTADLVASTDAQQHENEKIATSELELQDVAPPQRVIDFNDAFDAAPPTPEVIVEVTELVVDVFEADNFGDVAINDDSFTAFDSLIEQLESELDAHPDANSQPSEASLGTSSEDRGEPTNSVSLPETSDTPDNELEQPLSADFFHDSDGSESVEDTTETAIQPADFHDDSDDQEAAITIDYDRLLESVPTEDEGAEEEFESEEYVGEDDEFATSQDDDEYYRPVMQPWAQFPIGDESAEDLSASSALGRPEQNEPEEPSDDDEEPDSSTIVIDDSNVAEAAAGYFPEQEQTVEPVEAAPELPFEIEADEAPTPPDTSSAPAAETLDTTLQPAATALANPAGTAKLAETQFERSIQQLLAHTNKRKPFTLLLQGIQRLMPSNVSSSILLVSLKTPNRSADVTGTLASIVASDASQPVLLVDESFPGRLLSERFEANDEGIVELLDQSSSWQEAIRETATENLYLMPAGGGVVQERVKELVKNFDSFANLMNEWKQRYGHLFVDGGSVESPSCLELARYCDGVFLMVELGQDESDEATAAIHQLRLHGGRVLGCIVDDIAQLES